MIGTILTDRYKLLAELGSGGMAWVYLAEDLIRGGKVAVKILYPQHSQDPMLVHRFNHEARLSMSVSRSAPQPNVVCVLDYGADRDIHFLVMEYVPGQDLGELLQQQGALPWPTALHIARQVALALSHAHQLDIVHRDIKPSNIMVLSDGTTRVLDFGIARVRTSPHISLTGFVGTPHYAAPEQAQGQEADIRADIYSLGIVLYRMLSGALPFQGDTPWAVVNQHITGAPPPLTDLCPDLMQPVVHLVEKAMARSPEDRFQTPDEVVAAIDAVLSDPDGPADLPQYAPGLDLAAIYQHAQQAAHDKHWQEAVDLFSQILKIDPDYQDAASQLEAVGQHVHLAFLYRSAERALEIGQWEQALSQLDKIAVIEPGYRDTDKLRTRAENRDSAQGGTDADRHEFPTYVPTTKAESGPSGNDIGSDSGPPVESSLRPLDTLRRRLARLLGGPFLFLLLLTMAYVGFGPLRQLGLPLPLSAQPCISRLWQSTLMPGAIASSAPEPSSIILPAEPYTSSRAELTHSRYHRQLQVEARLTCAPVSLSRASDG